MILKVENVKKFFGGITAINNASFKIQANKITALIGPNGAGKTTIFNIISGLIKPDAGQIFFKNKNITHLSPYKRFNMGISRTFQDIKLFESLSTNDNFLIGKKNRKGEKIYEIFFNFAKEKQKELEELMKIKQLLGLNEKLELSQNINQLSYGIQKLVAIGRALMSNPELLMVDEPTSGLDEKSLSKIINAIKAIKETGVTIVIVEHNIRLIKEIADWIIFFHQGEVVKEGTFEEVIKSQQLSEIYFGKKLQEGYLK
ncbi:MAG: ABC transporter ATP-binding protein [Caldisphaera sp.]|jgi:ABC-type branched-subunit amino acid transport system ATPase component